MGAPGALHEGRVVDLETLATLAGFTTPLQLPWKLRPDVLRVHRAWPALFLGDAKATETPGCSATLGRLLWYLTALPRLAPALEFAVLALAVDEARARAWRRALVSAVARRKLTAATNSIAVVGEMAVVSVVLPIREPDRIEPYRVRACLTGMLDDLCAQSTSSAEREG